MERPFLSRHEAFEELRTEWDKETKTAPVLARFLPNFYANLQRKFQVEDNITYFQQQFFSGKESCCLIEDVVIGKVWVRAKKRNPFPQNINGDFDALCEKFYDRLAKRRHWYPNHDMRAMYGNVKAKNPQFGSEKYQFTDVLGKLIRLDMVEVKYKKKKAGRKRDTTETKTICNLFVKHLRSLSNEEKPRTRSLLKDEFERMFPDSQENSFVEVLNQMKKQRFLKFANSRAEISYLTPKKLTTDQHFVKRMDSADEEPSTHQSKNETHSNQSRQEREKLKNIKRLAADRHGISITSGVDNEIQKGKEIVDFGSIMQGDQRYLKTITIHYEATEGACQEMVFKSVKLLEDFDNTFTIGDKQNIKQGKQELKIKSGSSYQINAYYRSKNVGKHKSPLVMEFENSDVPNGFVIYRFLQAETRNSEVSEIMPKEPYQPLKPRQISHDPSVELVAGIPPERISNGQVKVKLPQYKVPSNIRFAVNSQEKEEHRKLLDSLKIQKDPDSYRKRFHALLYLEELQQEVDIRRFDMHDVGMQLLPTMIGLEVPGLAEGKPSLIIGDKVYASIQNTGTPQTNKKEYEGYVHFVERDRVQLKFHQSFHGNFIKGQRHNIRFGFNRGPMRLQHRAIDIASDLIQQQKFPSISPTWDLQFESILPEVAVERIKLYDRKIESNEEQLTAIKNIVMGSSRPYPYIIFGPPGTGKTVTSVEAMRQVLKLIPHSRILACAPSNSAADLILHRLLNPCPISKKQLFRMNAVSRSVNALPEEYDIKDYCKILNSHFVIPEADEILQYRVVVCTMTTAGRLTSMGISMEHFTHVFMDECGQAVEPEALIPLAGLLSPVNPNGGQIVLAGDPKQLGPVLRSPIASEHGLQLSLLERLMSIGPIYKKTSAPDNNSGDSDSDSVSSNLSDLINEALNDEEDASENCGYNSKYITKLIKNYRSHPAILKKPNEFFYDNELIPEADVFKTTTLCQWKELPSKNFPIIFHGVEGEDLREGNSPSFFNPFEATEVVKYVRLLLDERGLGVCPDEIGIISPYRKQVSKIRKLLEKENSREKIEELKVGSVEEFQGQERRIIIISTVRSNAEYLKLDSEFRLGFLKNPKRFNVAITRAQALLVVIGNPFVLSKDWYWKELLDYCIENGGYKGCQYGEAVVKSLAEQLSETLKFIF